MSIRFEIESIIHTRDKFVVLTRLLSSNIDWELSEKSKLGQVEIENWSDIPRAVDKNGNPRLDLFAFVLKNNEDKDKLQVNQIVELIP